MVNRRLHPENACPNGGRLGCQGFDDRSIEMGKITLSESMHAALLALVAVLTASALLALR